eukprot:29473-Pelagococcus_subviridis.AAC.4
MSKPTAGSAAVRDGVTARGERAGSRSSPTSSSSRDGIEKPSTRSVAHADSSAASIAADWDWDGRRISGPASIAFSARVGVELKGVSWS